VATRATIDSNARGGTSTRRCRLLVLSAVLLAAAPAPARADWLLAPFAGIKFKGETTLFDLDTAADKRKLTFGGSVMWLGEGPFGIEGDVAFVPGYFKADVDIPLVQSARVATVMGNAVLTVPRPWIGESLRPYVSGGFGLVHAQMQDVLEKLAFRRTLGGFNLGGGAMGFVGRSRRTGVRWDLRYVRGAGALGSGSSRPASFGSERLTFWRATMAVVFRY
jgi:hypothetical protein